MNNYKVQIPKQQLDIINYNIFNDNKRAKCLSVLAYALQNLNDDNSIRMSLDRLYARYSAWKGRGIQMGRTHFINLCNELVDLGILIIKKVGRLNKYFFNPTVDEKMNEKVDENNYPQTVENSDVEANSVSDKEKIRNSNLNTNTDTNIVDIIKSYAKSFKTIKGNTTMSKSELKQIARELFALRGVHEFAIQSMVMSKIHYSHQNINILGAVQYVNKIITEKLVETSNEYITSNTFGGYNLSQLESDLL